MGVTRVSMRRPTGLFSTLQRSQRRALGGGASPEQGDVEIVSASNPGLAPGGGFFAPSTRRIALPRGSSPPGPGSARGGQVSLSPRLLSPLASSRQMPPPLLAGGRSSLGASSRVLLGLTGGGDAPTSTRVSLAEYKASGRSGRAYRDYSAASHEYAI